MQQSLRIVSWSLLCLLLLVAGVSRAEEVGPCESAAPVAGIERRLSDARELMAQRRFGTAAGQLLEIERVLGCLDGPLPGRVLAQVFYLQGVCAARQGKSLEVLSRLEAAVSVFSSLQWDVELLPPEEHEAAVVAFGASVEAVLRRRAPVQVVVGKPGRDGSVWVDGKEVPQAQGLSLSLWSDVHLVQFKIGEKKYHGQLINLEGVTTYEVSSPRPQLQVEPRVGAGPIASAAGGDNTAGSALGAGVKIVVGGQFKVPLVRLELVWEPLVAASSEMQVAMTGEGSDWPWMSDRRSGLVGVYVPVELGALALTAGVRAGISYYSMGQIEGEPDEPAGSRAMLDEVEESPPELLFLSLIGPQVGAGLEIRGSASNRGPTFGVEVGLTRLTPMVRDDVPITKDATLGALGSVSMLWTLDRR